MINKIYVRTKTGNMVHVVNIYNRTLVCNSKKSADFSKMFYIRNENHIDIPSQLCNSCARILGLGRYSRGDKDGKN